MSPSLRTVIATRYVTPLREGGSLPAIAEADDDGMYAVKSRGAAPGRRAVGARGGGSRAGRRAADAEGCLVGRFRGAARGPRALVAELVAGEIGRALGLPVP